jgi:flagellar basal body-associated protein FliL
MEKGSRIKDELVEDALVEDLNIEDNSWKPRPKEKKSKLAVWIVVIIILVALILGFVMMGYFSSNGKVETVENSNQSTTITQEIVVGDYEDTDEIKTLKQEASVLFGEQIQAYFLDDPNKDEKIEEFENKMNQVMVATHQYYLLENNGGWEIADSSFVDFLRNLKYEDAIPLSEESIPYYLEKLHNIGE